MVPWQTVMVKKACTTRCCGTGDYRLLALEASHLHGNLVVELEYALVLTWKCCNDDWACAFPSTLQSLCAV
eukprot:5927452-Ditylum_brightwellii.AAC.1